MSADSQPHAKHALSFTDDTDHYPHQDALRFAARRLNKGDVSVVQGRCTIYNSKETWVTALLAAEFDK